MDAKKSSLKSIAKECHVAARQAHGTLVHLRRKRFGGMLVRSQDLKQIQAKLKSADKAWGKGQFEQAMTFWTESIESSLAALEKSGDRFLLGRLFISRKRIKNVRDHLIKAFKARQRFEQQVRENIQKSTKSSKTPLKPRHATARSLFDQHYYLEQHPELKFSGEDPWEHYQTVGWRKNYNPHPLFHVQWYLEQHPDVLKEDIDPLTHYAERGWSESRNPHPSFNVLLFYRLMHWQMANAGIEPLSQYLESHSFRQQWTTATTDYKLWLKENQSINPPSLAPLKGPVISIVVPVYDPPEIWLKRAIDSVLEQTYPHWELCLANDASPAPHVREVLDEYAARDSRIKVVHRERNGHISAASNSALELATGEFTALLDHDDELPPDALAEVVRAILNHPEAKLIYSDEDKIDEHGKRFDAYFKPDWNPDLLRGQNFLSHLSVYRTDVLRNVGGFRPGFEGSQDWDLALRVTEGLTAKEIVHIPRVLYHWRAMTGSTALNVSEKNYTVVAAEKALVDHLRRTGRNATLETVKGYHWRVIHALPETSPLVSIIIPTRNGLALLKRCIESIRSKTTYASYEIIIVDNQSDDPETISWLEQQSHSSDVRVLPYPHVFNYSAINNFAVRHAHGDVLLFLNNDTEVITPGWLEEIVSQACRPEVGCVGVMLYYPDDTVQHAGVLLGVGGVANHAFLTFSRNGGGYVNRQCLVQNYSAVTAACMAVRKSTFLAAKGFNEVDLQVAFNDVDFCLKVRALGYWNVWTPFAELYHYESISRGKDDTPAKRERGRLESEYIKRTWGDLLQNDPAYNPNLTLTDSHHTFNLAWPPRKQS